MKNYYILNKYRFKICPRETWVRLPGSIRFLLTCHGLFCFSYVKAVCVSKMVQCWSGIQLLQPSRANTATCAILFCCFVKISMYYSHIWKRFVMKTIKNYKWQTSIKKKGLQTNRAMICWFLASSRCINELL